MPTPPPDPCGRCGKVHVTRLGYASCSAHKSGMPDEPCRRDPIVGHTVCQMHGGATPGARQVAKRRLEFAATEGQVAQLLREADLPEQHPVDGLLEVVRHSGAMMRLLGHLVGGLATHPNSGEIWSMGEDGELVVRKEDSLYGPTSSGEAAPSVLVQMYERWTQIYGRACKLALDANIDERLVRNAEQTSEVMFRAIGDALEAGQLTPSQREAIVGSLAASLRKYGPVALK